MAAGIRAGELKVQGFPTDTSEIVLAGPSPTLRFSEDAMVLVANPGERSLSKWCSFRVGDVIPRAARSGDRLEATRDAQGRVVVCIYRGEHLVVAIGALYHASLGPDVHAEGIPGIPAARRARVTVCGVQEELHARESARVGPYDVYVEFPGESNPYGEGRSECLSIMLAADGALVNSARRSAVLMANQDDDPLCGELADGTMIKSGRRIP